MEEFKEIRNALTAQIKDKNGNVQRAVCKLVEYSDGERSYIWFFEDTIEGGFVPNEEIYGQDLEEAESEFEAVYGLLFKDDYKIRTGKWYSYPNRY